MTRLWTGRGDDGTTGLLYGGRVPKSSPRPEALGSVDEAQASIGVARAEATRGSELDELLVAVERDLWVLMGELATDPDNRSKLTPGSSLVTAEMVDRLSRWTDEIGARFEPPREFVVPGQDRCSALLDLARTVVRRAERAATAVADEGSLVVPYLNRLSSLLWTLARWIEGDPLTARSPGAAPPDPITGRRAGARAPGRLARFAARFTARSPGAAPPDPIAARRAPRRAGS